MADIALISVITSGIVGLGAPVILTHSSRERQRESLRHDLAIKEAQLAHELALTDRADLREALDSAFVVAWQFVNVLRTVARRALEHPPQSIRPTDSERILLEDYRRADDELMDMRLKLRLRLGKHHHATEELDRLAFWGEEVAEWYAPMSLFPTGRPSAHALRTFVELQLQLYRFIDAANLATGTTVRAATLAA